MEPPVPELANHVAPEPAPAAAATTSAKPKRGRKPKTAEETTVLSLPPASSEPSGRRIVKNSELVVMSDCWEQLADLPTAVQRRIVVWLDSQVCENEKAEASPTLPQ